MKKNILLLIVTLFSLHSSAQINTAITDYYYDTQIDKNKDIIVSAANIVAKFNYAKLKFIIENKSNNYIIFRKNKVKYKNDKVTVEASESNKPAVIRPYDKKSWTINFEGNSFFIVDTFSIIPTGISTFTVDGTVINAPKFHLPPNKNQFNAGDFVITMGKLKKETGKVAVSFKCTYNSDNIGIVSPSDVVLVLPDKSEWANVKSNIKPKILFKGDAVSFTLIYEVPGKIVDTQFAELDIDWKKCFRVSKEKQIHLNKKTIYIKISKK